MGYFPSPSPGPHPTIPGCKSRAIIEENGRSTSGLPTGLWPALILPTPQTQAKQKSALPLDQKLIVS